MNTWQPSGCSDSLQWALKNPECDKCRILAPTSWDEYERNDSSESRLIHLPIHRKVLNYLTWDIWFSLVHINTASVHITCPLLQTSIQPDSSPPTSSQQFSWGYLRSCLLVLSPKNSHQIKHNSQLLGCMYFSVEKHKVSRERFKCHKLGWST